MIKKTEASSRSVSLFIIALSVIGLAVGLLFPSPAKADDLPVVFKFGTISADETWSAGSVYVIGSTVTVPEDVTLTIEAGAIVKYPSSWSNAGIVVDAGATLDVAGSEEEPVTFTSYKDDSVGGDSNENGSSSGAVGDYNEAISPYGGTVVVQHAAFRYSYTTVNGSSSVVTIADSVFSDTYGGISLGGSSTAVNDVDLQRNHFSASTEYPIYVNYMSNPSGILLAGSNKNTFSGNGPAATVAIQNTTIPTGTTWEISSGSGAILKTIDQLHINGTLQIDSGVVFVESSSYAWTLGVQVSGSLILQHGAIIKTTHSQGIEVASGGSLSAQGTSGDPVIFTSLKDDSAGGDTNGDGSSSGAASDYDTALSPNGGTIDVAYCVFRYASTVINGSSSDVTVNDSTFTNMGAGISLTGSYTSPNILNLARNHFAVSGGNPVSINYLNDSTGLVLNGSDKNTFEGTGIDATVSVRNVTVPVGKTWTVSPDSGAILMNTDNLTVNGTMILASGMTFVNSAAYSFYLGTHVNGQFTVQHGAVIKTTHSLGMDVASGGTLTVTGTSSDPVIFTSLKDDSVAGDTGSDGATTGAIGDYSQAISLSGTLNAQYATFKYAYDGITGSGSANITDSSFTDMGTGISLGGTSSQPITLSLQRNHFEVSSGDYAVQAWYANDATDIVLAGSNKNTFTGTGKQVTVSIGNTSVHTGDTWEISAASGAIVKAMTTFTVDGTLQLDAGVVFVVSGGNAYLPAIQVNGSMTIASGVIVKTASSLGVGLNNGSTLDVNGTSGSPVIFTSLTDDSAGGDTNSNGSSSGSANSYGASIMSNDATINAEHAIFRYATTPITVNDGTVTLNYADLENGTTGLYVDHGDVNLQNATINNFNDGIDVVNGSVIVRGDITNITSKGVHACNWGANCLVDASHVNWGSDDGPFPSSGSLVCGQVLVGNWVGLSNVIATSNIFGVANCDNSAKPTTQLPAKNTSFSDMISSLGIDCSNNIQSACDAAARRTSCMQTAYNLAKDNVDVSFDLPAFTVSGLASAVTTKLADHIVDSVTTDGTGSLLGATTQAIGLVKDLNTAYDTCLGA